MEAEDNKQPPQATPGESASTCTIEGGNAGQFDPESQERVLDFSIISCRQGFIRKVYSILMVQLLITSGFIALFLYHDDLRKIVHNNTTLIIVALVLSLIIIVAIVCCEQARRRFPYNFLVLLAFTVVEGFLVGVIASTYETESVLLAAGITVVICFALTIFAFQTKWDFTGMGPYLFVACIVLFMFGLFASLLRSLFPILHMVYSSLGALFFSLYLIYDTQFIIGGHHKQSISPEEYTFAALSLYLDILNIFLKILALMGKRRS